MKALRKLAALVGFGLVALSGLTQVQAQSYPSRPVTLIVPWGAGGGTDALARSFASELEKQFGQPVNVVNRTGGSGIVGHSAIASAKPDGYTIGIATIEIATFKALGLGDLSPENLTPIAHLASSPASITVRADSPWADAKAALEGIKQSEKGKLIASGTGQGGSWHFAIAGLLRSQGLAADHVRWVPSQGGAPALQDLLAGGINIFAGSPAEALALREAGRVRSLLIMHPERVPAYSEIPTLKEVSGTDWVMGSPYGLAAPVGLPADIRAKLASAAEAAYKSESFQSFLRQRGYAPQWMDAETFAAFLKERTQTLGIIAQEMGIAK